MARSTNGSSDLITFGDLSGILSTGDGSMAIWIRNTGSASGNYQSVFSSGTQRGGGGNDNFNFEITSSGDGHPNNWSVNVATGGTASTVFLGSALDSNWHSVGMSYASSGTIVTGYLDGVNKGTSNNVARSNPSVATSIGVGHNSGGSNAEFAAVNGVADAAIWSVILTSAEFAALANGARPFMIRPSSLLFWAPIDGLQSPEPELSGRKNNGTLTGTAKVAGPPIMMLTPRWNQPAPSPPIFRRTQQLGTRTGSRQRWVA